MPVKIVKSRSSSIQDQDRFYRIYEIIFPISLGIIAFLMLIGPRVLIPTNIAWLGDGYDPTQHYLGWVFFRHTPWSFPIGLNPSYGLDISSAIVFSDSIPILAFLFKPFSAILPEPFQYIGIWMLTCFILQAYFGWLLVSLITNNRITKILAVSLLLIAPPMLFRFGLHAALAGHFLILAALYLNLRHSKRYQVMWWALLLSVTALVHFYLFVMVFGLWLADLLDRYKPFFKTTVVLSAVKEISLIFILLLVTVWQAGYFLVSTSSAATGDYGFYNFNLLAPLQSDGWSYFFPNWLHPINGEGFNFFGTGIIFTLIASLRFWFKKNISMTLISGLHTYRYLAITLCLLTLFAISNHVVIGSWEILIPIPDIAHQLASILRGSGRMFWPMWYVLVLGAIYALSRSYSATMINIILLIALCMQMIDTSAGWLPKKRVFESTPSTQLSSPLSDPFWQAAASKYKKVIRTSLPVSPVHYYVDWDTWANYASKNHLGTNSAWLSRYNRANLSDSNSQLNESLQTGEWDPSTLYILENEKMLAALQMADPSRDLVALIDGYYVLAPNWKKCHECLIVPQAQELLLEQFAISPGETISFAKTATPKYLLNVGNGWAHREQWGVWSDGILARLTLLLPKQGASHLDLYARAFITPMYRAQDIEMTVNGRVTNFSLMKPDGNLIRIPIAKEDWKSRYLNIQFVFKNPIRPKEVGISDDGRLLAIGLEGAVFK